MTNFDLRYSTLSSNGRSVIDITGKDLNDILTSGAYSGTNCYNSPVSSEMMIELIVTKHSNDWIVQEVKVSEKKIYLRAWQNKKWTNWDLIDVQEVVNNTGSFVIEVVDRPHSHTYATHSTGGFMSPDDKTKLDSLGGNISAEFVDETSNKNFVTEEEKEQIKLIANLVKTVAELKQELEDIKNNGGIVNNKGSIITADGDNIVTAEGDILSYIIKTDNGPVVINSLASYSEDIHATEKANVLTYTKEVINVDSEKGDINAINSIIDLMV